MGAGGVTPLNLATRPFRNERLPALAFALGTGLVLALTVWHGLALRRVLPVSGSTLSAEVAALDAELEALEAEEGRLLGVRPAPDRIEEWRSVKELVDQRVFAWTALLDRLEALLPPGVRLQSITPTLRDGVATLSLQAHARSLDDGLALWQALLDSGEFPGALQESVDEREDGVVVDYSMRYSPRPRQEPAADAGAVSEEAG
jgi:Tfp pilus assembly protein PilN